MLILLLIASVSSNTCLETLKQEGASILQLLVGDYTNLPAGLIAAQQILYSGKDINDLGHWSSCVDLSGSTYLIVNLKLSDFPTYMGLCVPSDCTVQAIEELITDHKTHAFSRYLQEFSLAETGHLLRAENLEIFPPKTYSLGTGGVLAVMVYLALVGAIVAGSYFDYKLEKKQELKQEGVELTESLSINPIEDIRPPKKLPGYIRLLLCFSFPKNWESLFVASSSDTTSIFNGIRALSIGWVILGHVYLTRVLSPTYNLEDIVYVAKSPLSAFGYSAVIGVDAFFWLGGFLLGFSILGEALKRKGRVSWLPKIVGRVLRILPVYIFVMTFVNLVEPSMGEGPLWHQMDLLTLDCSSYWWTNFLFLNNFVPAGEGNDCIGQSWYLALDMQFFLFSILIIAMYSKLPKIYTWITVAAICMASLITRIVISSEYNVMVSALNSHQRMDHSRLIFTKPYTRIAPYVLGLLCGFVYYQYSIKNFFDGTAKLVVGLVTRTKIVAYGVFFLGVGLINIAMWVPMNCYSDDKNDFMYYSYAGNVAFQGFFTLLTGLGFTFMFLPVLFGMIPLAYAILSWKAWVPIAKASFSIYLTHLFIMRGFLAQEEYGFTFTQLNLFADFVFNATLEIPAGMIVYATVEAPFSRLLKAAFAPRSRQPKEQPLLSKELETKA